MGSLSSIIRPDMPKVVWAVAGLLIGPKIVRLVRR